MRGTRKKWSKLWGWLVWWLKEALSFWSCYLQVICFPCPHIWKLLQGELDFPSPFSRTWIKPFINHSCEHISLFYHVRILLTLDGAQFSLSQLLQCPAAIMLISTNNEIQYPITLFCAFMTYLLPHNKTIPSLTQMLTISGYVNMPEQWKGNSRSPATAVICYAPKLTVYLRPVAYVRFNSEGSV